MMRPYVFFMMSWLAVTACDKDSSSQVQLSDSRPQKAVATPSTPAPEEVAEVEEPVEELIDASSLRVFGTTVSDLRKNGNLVASLSYEPDGRLIYADYLICPMENTGQICPKGTPADACGPGGECFRGVTAYNRVILPNLYKGQVQIKVRACIDINRAKGDETCGPWDEYLYNSQRFDPRLASLEAEGQRLKKDLGKIVAEEYKKALEDYVKDSEDCDRANTEAKALLDKKVGIIKTYIRAPVEWFQQAGEDVADSILGRGATELASKEIGKFGAKVAKMLGKGCDDLGKVTTKEWVCTISKGLVTQLGGIVTGMSPVSAIATATYAIHDIYYGVKGDWDKLVGRTCNAEQNLQSISNAIKAKMEMKMNLLDQVKQQLDADYEGTTVR